MESLWKYPLSLYNIQLPWEWSALEQRTKDAIYTSYRRTIIVFRFLPPLIILGPLCWSLTVESHPFCLILCFCFMPAQVSWRICMCAPCISQNCLGIKRNDIDHRVHHNVLAMLLKLRLWIMLVRTYLDQHSLMGI